jgi:hypothetical protein
MANVRETELHSIYMAINYMSNLENQDRGMVIDMSQAMIDDLITDGALSLMKNYVQQFCDVIDGQEDIDRITSEIIHAINNPEA